MGNNILLVSANMCQDPYKVFPLGMMCLHTYIADHFPNWDISFFDFNLQSDDDFSRLLQEKPFDYIGISLRNCDDINFYTKNSFLDHYISICTLSRQKSNAKLIVGGPCVSIFPSEIMELLKVDYAIIGEGEESLCDLIICLETGKGIQSVEGLVYREKGGIKINPRRHFIAESHIRFNPDLAAYYFDEGGMLNIQTKRGCPYHCIYCSYPAIDGKTVRVLDSKLVVENIKDLFFNQKIDYLFFTDSVFNICEEYNLELAHRIIESKVKISWGAYFSPNHIRKENMALYKHSGLTHVEFGTDSLSDKQLVNYKKHFAFNDIKKASDICYELGIFYAHFLILGGIGETEQTLNETFENSKKLKHTVYFPFIGMRIYPKTELYEIAVKEGLITQKDALKPVYYISKECDIDAIKQKAANSGMKWFFPDAEKSTIVDKLKEKKVRGPLWEYLRY